MIQLGSLSPGYHKKTISPFEKIFFSPLKPAYLKLYFK